MKKIKVKEFVPLVIIVLSVCVLFIYIINSVEALSAMNENNYQTLIDLQAGVGVILIPICVILSTIGLYLKMVWRENK